MSLILILYIVLVTIASVYWLLISQKNGTSKNVSFTIIVPVRNEEKHLENLLNSIKNLDYQHYELIVINDLSTDGTQNILESFQKKWTFKIINLERTNSSPKKMAIQRAIQEASGDYILCTDGDCILPAKILQKYAYQFLDNGKLFLSGPVTFFEPQTSFLKSIWTKFQIVEFASLTGVGAVAMHLQKPNMCSGANISFNKDVFFELNGYEGNLQLASGDDEFLMHKFANAYPGKVAYVKDQDCIVETASADNLNTFLEQRKRWASKWRSYESLLPSLLAFFIFTVNIISIFLEWYLSFKWLMLRYVLEAFFIGNVLWFLKKQNSLWYIIPVQILYKYYVVFTAFSVLLGKKTYIWKGRNLK